MIVIQAKLIFLTQQDKQIVLDLMKRWSSCMRFAYKRLLEGYNRNTLKRDLQGTFDLNSRYVDDAIMKARSTLESSKELGSNPKKVIFGGRKLFKKLQKRHINGKAYKKLKIRFYIHFTKINISSFMEYDADFLFGIVALILKNLINLLIIFFIFHLIDNIKGWDFNQILFLYGFSSTSFAIWQILFHCLSIRGQVY